MLRWIGFAAIIASFVVCTASRADSQGTRGIALVVGNNLYQNVPALSNPDNDATLVANTLQSLGFTIVGGGPQLDLTRDAFLRSVKTFGADIGTANIALFYYAGHGVQVNGENYLVPVDANPGRLADASIDMVDIAQVIGEMASTNAGLKVIILDACRNNPFARSDFRALSPGLATIQAPHGTMIAYATGPGEVAQDGAGKDSPYSTSLAQALGVPALEATPMFQGLYSMVMDSTQGAQDPWFSAAYRGAFYFAGGQPAQSPICGQAATFPWYGGSGGSCGVVDCGPNEAMIGLTGTMGSWIYQLGVICGSLTKSADGTTKFEETSQNGGFGSPYPYAQKFALKCGSDAAMTGITIGTASYNGGTYVGSVRPNCSPIHLLPDGTVTLDSSISLPADAASGSLASNPASADCAQGKIMKLNVRSGNWVDAMAVECGSISLKSRS